MVSIEETKKKRFQFLRRLYEETEGSKFNRVDSYQVGEKHGFDRDLTDKITQYLNDENLIKFVGLNTSLIEITHEGVREVEEALSNPDAPTTHFPPLNIIIGPVINSPIQQGSPQATQEVIIGEDKCEELKGLLQSLKESIDKLGLEAQAKSDLQADIQTIEAQMSSSKPKLTIITECVGSIRNILEGAAGNVLASLLLNKINVLCGLFMP